MVPLSNIFEKEGKTLLEQHKLFCSVLQKIQAFTTLYLYKSQLPSNSYYMQSYFWLWLVLTFCCVIYCYCFFITLYVQSKQGYNKSQQDTRCFQFSSWPWLYLSLVQKVPLKMLTNPDFGPVHLDNLPVPIHTHVWERTQKLWCLAERHVWFKNKILFLQTEQARQSMN